jgi:hypothetical protein
VQYSFLALTSAPFSNNNNETIFSCP